MRSETVQLTIKLSSPVGPEEIGFRFKPALEGIRVSIITKAVIPIKFDALTNSEGIAIFPTENLFPPEVPPCEMLKSVKWLLFASKDGTGLGYFKDEASFTCGKLYDITLKEYKEAPTFWLKIQMREVIGAEFFGQLAADFEAAALEQAGLEIVKVEGKGTRTITLYFKPPFIEESPIVINWVAVWFILKVIAVALAVIAILVVFKWTFGETAAPVALGLAAAAVVAIALLTRKKEEVRTERTYQR